jgi:adenosylhomocysteine nucleosidase
MTRVAMLAPMTHELDPIVRQIGMDDDGSGVHRGKVDDVEVVALLTMIGMDAGAAAAERALALDVDWVMVVGIAGGVDQSLTIGDVVVPEVLIDRRDGRSYRQRTLGDITPRGVISCGDDLITDPDAIAAMAEEGVLAVEMEGAAVAAVCEEAETPWSVFRGISDFADAGLVDDAIFEMTNPDGSADEQSMKRYLDEHPERLAALTQLAHDMNLATEAAAATAIRACAALA